MNDTYSITSKFQVTIPKDIRDQVGLTEADKVRFVRTGNRVYIRRAPSITDIQKMNQRFIKRKKIGPVSDQDIKNAHLKIIKENNKW